MDYTHDELAGGRKFRTLNLMDGYTREALRIEPDTSLPGLRVVRVLEELRKRRGTPAAIQVDNGTEFTSRIVDQWAYQNRVALHFIERGKPTQNALIESFNGKFRDECLNQNWFVSLNDARRIIENWRVDYNTVRPHSSLGYRTPAEFAAEIGGEKGCGKDGGSATLENASRFPLSYSHGDGAPILAFVVESKIPEANLGLDQKRGQVSRNALAGKTAARTLANWAVLRATNIEPVVRHYRPVTHLRSVIYSAAIIGSSVAIGPIRGIDGQNMPEKS